MAIGVWGCFDVDALDDQVRLRVLDHELRRRSDAITIRAGAPFGSMRPITVAADVAVEALAPWTTARHRSLGDELDAVIVCRTAVTRDPALALERYVGHPTVDPDDVRGVLAMFADPPGDLAVMTDTPGPELGLLARRVWPVSVCTQRLEFLRAMQWWPAHGAPTVVIGTHDDASPATDGAVVTVGSGPTSFLDRVRDAAGQHFAMADSLSSIGDRVAAIAGAALVVTDDPAVAAIAAAYGRPCRSPFATPSTSAVVADTDTLDRHLDAIVQQVTAHPRTTSGAAEIEALRATLARQLRTVAHERVVLADYVGALRAELDARESELADLRRRSVRARLAAVVRRTR